MLNEKQIKAAKLYAEGHKLTDIAKMTGISRQSLYNWLDNKEFTTEVDKLLQEIRTSAEKSMTNNVENYIKELENIAFCGRSEKNRTDALTYLLDRVLGRSTNRVQEIKEQQQPEPVSWADLEDLEPLQVLDFKDKKKSI